MLRFSRCPIVPRKDKAALVPFAKVVSLPLLYRSASRKGVEVAISDACPPKILYVGRRDDRRKLNLFQSETFRDSIRKKARGCTFDFFPPRADSFATTDEKLAAFKQATAVLNFYTVPYNQSGVTVDALINGVPVLVSDFDPHAEIMRQYGLSLPAGSGDDKIASALLQMIRDQEHLKVVAKRLGDKLGSTDAFQVTWLKWLASIQDRHLSEVKDIEK
jgi:glycosyltransferase involved in cell wall biosynthesis